MENEKIVEEKRIEEKSWELYNECKMFLEENEKNWEKSKIERETEKKKVERLEKARNKQETLRLKIKTRKLEEEIEKNIEKLPEKNRREIETEEKKNKKIELARMKKTLWKLRNKQKKGAEKTENMKKLEKIEQMEEKLNTINEILRKIQEEKEKRKIQDEKKQQEKLKEWRRKVKEKDRKESERKEKIEKQNKILEHWEMMKWITEYIKINQEKWDLERERKEIEARKEIDAWEKMKRKDKIKVLQEKWRKETVEQDNVARIEPDEKLVWKTWREKSLEKSLEKKQSGGQEKKLQNLEEMKSITEIEAVIAIRSLECVVSIGGGPLGAGLLKHNPKPHSVLLLEGDPPLGKDRGALGEGKGTKTPPSAPKTRNTHKNQEKLEVPSIAKPEIPLTEKTRNPIKPAILKPPKSSDKPAKKKPKMKTTLKPQKNKITTMFKVEMKTTCVQDNEIEDDPTESEDNPTRNEDNPNVKPGMEGVKHRQSASVILSDQEYCRPMKVQNNDGTVQDSPRISRFFNQHEHPDLGQNPNIKTFTIHDNLLANPNHNPDILPDNR